VGEGEGEGGVVQGGEEEGGEGMMENKGKRSVCVCVCRQSGGRGEGGRDGAAGGQGEEGRG